MADGTGLRPLYPEASYEWITHEAVITKDEVAIAILYLRPPIATTTGRNSNAWGPATDGRAPDGRRHRQSAHPRDADHRAGAHRRPGPLDLARQRLGGRPLGVADDFRFRLWLIDRHTGEMALLASMGEKTMAADHIHPTFNADGTKIEIQSAMLSANNRSLNICVVPVPKAWLARTYDDKNRLLAQ